MSSRQLAALSTVLLLAACTPGGAPAPAPSAGASASAGALGGLPECTTEPVAIDTQVEGLTLPEGSVVTKVTPQKPLVNVSAFVPMTPVEFENSFRDRDGVNILFSENEVFEAEMLISNGRYRNFHKATATCRRGSLVLAVVAPELDAKGLPLPAGATATPKP